MIVLSQFIILKIIVPNWAKTKASGAWAPAISLCCLSAQSYLTGLWLFINVKATHGSTDSIYRVCTVCQAQRHVWEIRTWTRHGHNHLLRGQDCSRSTSANTYQSMTSSCDRGGPSKMRKGTDTQNGVLAKYKWHYSENSKPQSVASNLI
jgi:hypothetical protein